MCWGELRISHTSRVQSIHVLILSNSLNACADDKLLGAWKGHAACDALTEPLSRLRQSFGGLAQEVHLLHQARQSCH